MKKLICFVFVALLLLANGTLADDRIEGGELGESDTPPPTVKATAVPANTQEDGADDGNLTPEQSLDEILGIDEPTLEPTADPNPEPTEEPTLEPTAEPTAETVAMTADPSAQPAVPETGVNPMLWVIIGGSVVVVGLAIGLIVLLKRKRQG